MQAFEGCQNNLLRVQSFAELRDTRKADEEACCRTDILLRLYQGDHCACAISDPVKAPEKRTGPQQRRGASRTIGDGLKDPCHSSLSEVHHAVMLRRKLLHPEKWPGDILSWPDLGRRRPKRKDHSDAHPDCLTAFNQESAPLRAQARNFAAEPAQKAVQRMGPFSQNRNCGEPTRKAIAELSLCPNEFTWSVGLPQH